MFSSTTYAILENEIRENPKNLKLVPRLCIMERPLRPTRFYALSTSLNSRHLESGVDPGNEVYALSLSTLMGTDWSNARQMRGGGGIVET